MVTVFWVTFPIELSAKSTSPTGETSMQGVPLFPSKLTEYSGLLGSSLLKTSWSSSGLFVSGANHTRRSKLSVGARVAGHCLVSLSGSGARPSAISSAVGCGIEKSKRELLPFTLISLMLSGASPVFCTWVNFQAPRHGPSPEEPGPGGVTRGKETVAGEKICGASPNVETGMTNCGLLGSLLSMTIEPESGF